ncbi:MAG: DNA recombination protein RmuC, partial [Candidatus Aureabacteria bacterium]|nr:DNA recombination protein RmuC [Candidatus Auribacterota bacterium]
MWVIAIAAAALVVLGVLVVLSLRATARKIEDLQRFQENNQSLNLMQQQLGQLSDRLDRQLSGVNRQLQTATSDLGRSIADVSKGLGEVSQVTQKVFEAARDISQLEKLLKAPKFRGGLGELILGDLLAQMLPAGAFEIQYRFKSGEIVDAAIRIGGNLVPVDSKFPLENFRRVLEATEEKDRQALKNTFLRDVKKHIDAIASKYILPDEGTFDFALMYIPAESVYYEVIVRDEALGEDKGLYQHALEKRVIPVSPNSFFAYLQVVVLGLKGLKIEKGAREIVNVLDRLRGDFQRFRGDFEMAGTHLANAKTKYDEAERRLDRLGDRLLSAGRGETPVPGDQNPG